MAFGPYNDPLKLTFVNGITPYRALQISPRAEGTRHQGRNAASAFVDCLTIPIGTMFPDAFDTERLRFERLSHENISPRDL